MFKDKARNILYMRLRMHYQVMPEYALPSKFNIKIRRLRAEKRKYRQAGRHVLQSLRIAFTIKI